MIVNLILKLSSTLLVTRLLGLRLFFASKDERTALKTAVKIATDKKRDLGSGLTQISSIKVIGIRLWEA